MKKVITFFALFGATCAKINAQTIGNFTIEKTGVSIVTYGNSISLNNMDTTYAMVLRKISREYDKAFVGETFQITRANHFGVATMLSTNHHVFLTLNKNNEYVVLVHNLHGLDPQYGLVFKETSSKKAEHKFSKEDVIRLGDQYSIGRYFGTFFVPPYNIGESQYIQP